MCGRYLLTSPGEVIAQAFGVMVPEVSWTVRYNVAPGTDIPAVCERPVLGRTLDFLSWGFVPPWRDPDGADRQLINARSETVDEKPSFRAAFRRQRCLLPADGFYEWQKVAGRKRPQLMRRPNRQPFAMAGIFESREGSDGRRTASCAVLTTRANDALQEIHTRMPVILAPESWDAWLDPTSVPETLLTLCHPVADAYLDVTAVGDRVNNPRHDDALCLAPAGSPQGAPAELQGRLF